MGFIRSHSKRQWIFINMWHLARVYYFKIVFKDFLEKIILRLSYKYTNEHILKTLFSSINVGTIADIKTISKANPKNRNIYKPGMLKWMYKCRLYHFFMRRDSYSSTRQNPFAYLYTIVILHHYQPSTTSRIIKQLPYNQCMVFHLAINSSSKIKAIKLSKSTLNFLSLVAKDGWILAGGKLNIPGFVDGQIFYV